MRLLLIFLSCPECEVPAEITDRSPPAAGGWQRDRASANQTVVIVVGSSSHATHRVVGSVTVSLARHSPVPVVIVP